MRDVIGETLDNALREKKLAEKAARVAIRVAAKESARKAATKECRDAFDTLAERNKAVIDTVAEFTDGGNEWTSSSGKFGKLDHAARLVVLGEAPVTALTPNHTAVCLVRSSQVPKKYTWGGTTYFADFSFGFLTDDQLEKALGATGDPFEGLDNAAKRSEQTFVSGDYIPEGYIDLTQQNHSVSDYDTRKERRQTWRKISKHSAYLSNLEANVQWVIETAALDSELNPHLPLVIVEEPEEFRFAEAS